MNFSMAWISILLVMILSIIYILRILIRKAGVLKKPLQDTNRGLRKYHRELGLLLIITGLVHGLFSSDKLFSLNAGTVCWVLSIALGVNWLIRKRMIVKKSWMYYHRILTAAFLVTIVVHVADAGGVQVFNVLAATPNADITDGDSHYDLDNYLGSQEADQPLFNDGTYMGEATGFRPGLQVSVTIHDGKITDIIVTDHNEINERFYQTPIEKIPDAIIKSQTTDVDVVSGATYTSIGIINAVRDALSKAVISGTLPDTNQNQQIIPEENHDGEMHKGGKNRRNGGGSHSF